jgi:hypothetical protein
MLRTGKVKVTVCNMFGSSESGKTCSRVIVIIRVEFLKTPYLTSKPLGNVMESIAEKTVVRMLTGASENFGCL